MAFKTSSIEQKVTLSTMISKDEINEGVILVEFKKIIPGRILVDCLDYELIGFSRISDDGNYYYQNVKASFLEYVFDAREILIGRIKKVLSKYLLVDLGGFNGYLLKNQISNENIFFDEVNQKILKSDNTDMLKCGDIIKVMVTSQINNIANPFYLFGIRFALSMKRADLRVLNDKN